MENKEFLELLNKFYDNGLLKEVYRSPRAIVCNVFNQYYLAFSLDIIENIVMLSPVLLSILWG